MDIDTCISEYIDMAPNIFPVEGAVSGSDFSKLVKAIRGKQRFDPVPLEEAVKRLVKKHLENRATRGEDTLLRFEASRDKKSPQCKMYGACSFRPGAKLTMILDLYALRLKKWELTFDLEAMKVLGMTSTCPFGRPVVQLQLHQHSSRPW